MESVEAIAARRLRRPLVARFVRQLFVIYVACNMLVCTVVFAPWALPRETVSGILGRWKSIESGWKAMFGKVGAAMVDLIYFWEPNHCVEVFLVEQRAREILYP